jgi:hypothetical protein
MQFQKYFSRSYGRNRSGGQEKRVYSVSGSVAKSGNSLIVLSKAFLANL